MVLMGSVLSSQAQKPAFSFQSKLSADSILIGDQVELSIQVSLPKGYQVQFPFFADTLITGIEVIGQPTIDTLAKRTDDTEFTYRLKLTSFDEGYYRIPGFSLPFSDGVNQDTAQTSPIWFMVNTLPPDTTLTSIYDIKLPIEEPITLAEVVPWVGGSLLIAGIIALIALYLIKRKKNEPLFFPRKPVDPPHVVALRELEKIKEKKLWNTDNHKHYQTVLTDVIRDYIEGRFSIPAMEQTTDETIRSLKKSEVLSSRLIEGLQETLSLADLVKFARFKPEISENEAGLDFGFRFVNETKIEVVEEDRVDDHSEEILSESKTIEDNEKPKALPVEPIKTDEP
ncbi:MAG: hypothetical protein CVT98_10400 [Bacteroidetes bacterium HGW-Bacteroidetes-15]|nr:MAG: hypothetical protein CVT98_10400 [Bacteroidetes bacterium HGW-Bacteroidetes-15]